VNSPVLPGGNARPDDSSLGVSLNQHLGYLHERLRAVAPDVDRVAVALFDAEDGTLATFVNSTLEGFALRGYRYPLADSRSLSELARTRATRVIDDIPDALPPDTQHSAFVRDEGYLSSFTVPLDHEGRFLGFVFYDSRTRSAFTPELQRELFLYSQIIASSVATEQAAVQGVIGTIQVVRDLTELRDVETGSHLARMSRYARQIARNLVEPLDLDDEFVEAVFLYAPLHDVGKIGIPDRILLKSGDLDDEERAIMRTHTTKGREMVDAISRDLGVGALRHDTVMRNIVELHHEALDGSGYPHGLVGDQIPLEARIVTVADIFDALTSARPYKPAWPLDRAFAELDDLVAAGKLDGRCVEALRQSPDEAMEVMERHVG
jgi:HD-GYP domain-containing protein (c-di-GMP phosphodiesterase class II)